MMPTISTVALTILLAVVPASTFAAPSPAAPTPDAPAPASSTGARIINDPNRLDWDYYGTSYKLKPIRDASLPGGAAVEVSVSKGAKPYADGANIPLSAPIVAGRDYVVRFFARTISSSADDKLGRILVRFARNADPYPGFGDTTILIGPDWKAYEVSARAPDTYEAEAVVAFQLAGARQKLQIGRTTVAEGTTSLDGHQARVAADPLPPQLATRGTLLNDPVDRNWVTYGAGQVATPTTTDVYTRKAVLLSVPAAGSNSWDAGVNAPIQRAIAKGDALTVALLARTRSAAAPDGLGLIRLRLQSNESPYDGFGAQDIRVGPGWKLVQWQVVAAMDLPEGRGEVAIHTGLARQDVEIGPVYVLRAEPAR